MKRKLLFTHEDVLLHEVGIGSSSFTHSHNRRSEFQQKEGEIANSTLSENSNCPPLEDTKGHSDEETDLRLAHNVQELSIVDEAVKNSASIGVLKGAAPHEEEDKSNNGVTFIVPVNNLTTFQSTKHFPMATTAVGNHGNCTSVFIDVVEWLSPLVVGQLEGKVNT